MSRQPHAGQTGYWELLAGNRDFRRLFTGQLVSQIGDWFNTVAVFTLVLSLTGRGESIAYVLILKLLPTFIFGPLAGVAADRFDRKTIMIIADLLRGLEVLGFLLVRRPEQVWIVYLLTGLEVFISAFFDPAKSASIPNIVSTTELVSANALSGASWSATLAIGAALGGIVTGLLGRNSAFLIDSLSFFVSASFISFVHIPRLTDRGKRTAGRPASVARIFGITDLIDGARYLRANPRVLALLLVKTGWGMGGGVLLLLTIYGKEVFPVGRDGSVSIGLLYAARGVGAMIGPFIAQVFARGSTTSMRTAIAVAYFETALFYLLFGHAPGLAFAAAFAVGAHAGGSIQWVYSTTLLQIVVPDRFRGRVFALDMACLTLTMSLSTYFTGWGLDHAGIPVRTLATVLGLVFIIPGLAWTYHVWRMSRMKPGLPVQLPDVDGPSSDANLPSDSAKVGPETSAPPV
ncbi:MAG TPA: MFS transporter [Blastocatellia bacterium]|nr:MFS transporter [Blastocatellia bacterium]